MKKKNNKKQTLEAQQKELVEFVISNLQSGTPWVKSFGFSSSVGLPKSISTGKRYSGGNCFLLAMIANSRGYESNEWGTFRAWNKAGAKIIKGQKSSFIIFYKPIVKTEMVNGVEETKRFFILKGYSVFNRSQTDLQPNVDVAEYFDIPKNGGLHSYLEKESITLQSIDKNRAFYSPVLDVINMPTDFISEAESQTTFAHEIIHSTGHSKRLNREGIADFNFFGSHRYSYEELIAEIGSMFLANDLGFESDFSKQNSAAYLSSWARKLESNPKWLWKAAGEASRACNFVIDRLDIEGGAQ